MCNCVYFITIGACAFWFNFDVFFTIHYRVVFYAVFYIEMIVILCLVLKLMEL